MGKISKFFALLLWICINMLCWAIPAQAQTPFGQTLQINTHFRSIIGKPTWLLILRDLDTGVVSPYLFDIMNNDNFWIAFSFGRNYIITVSNVKFGPFAIINNFCHIENKILSGKSVIISLSGDLTPSRTTINCHAIIYNDSAFPIAE